MLKETTRWRLLGAAGALALGFGMSTSHAASLIQGNSAPKLTDSPIQVAEIGGGGGVSAGAGADAGADASAGDGGVSVQSFLLRPVGAEVGRHPHAEARRSVRPPPTYACRRRVLRA